ncbi:MAG TPA: DUF6265 family protein [Thermoanaerobaculia bacterium]|nr:DUF6265 family protein [Thermoanaerobaculia bacterium]
MRSVGSFLLIVLLAATVPAQERQTENTFKLGDRKPGAATIADMAWLAGHWKGEALGGISEEIWSPPMNGVMMGMYRLVRDGKVVFYELLTLSEKDGSLVIRLKHFNPDMTGWEEKDKYVEFPLVSKSDGRIHFAGMTFVPKGDHLTVFLAIRQKDGTTREETFRYDRVASLQ